MVLTGKTVFVTGASSGIGAACAGAFAAEGARLVLAARRRERLKELASKLEESRGADALVVPLDVRDREAVDAAVKGLRPPWDEIDVLVNNAGLSRGLAPLHEGSVDDWEEMIETNVKGLLYLTRAVVPGMVRRGRGHVINIGSIAGHEVYPRGNVYCATKFAVHAISEGLRMDLVDTPVRVSEVAPGLVRSEFSLVRFRGDAERAAGSYRNFDPLEPEDVAETVLFCATRPPRVSVNQVVVMPAAQRSIMVHRRR